MASINRQSPAKYAKTREYQVWTVPAAATHKFCRNALGVVEPTAMLVHGRTPLTSKRKAHMARVNISEKHPSVYKKVAELSKAAEEAALAAGLDPRLIELVKIRVSQMNGCAFCCRLHTRDALNLGETADRLAVLPVWWESQYFSGTEQAALGLAEEATRLPGRTDMQRDNGALTEEQVSAVTWVALVMNAWNRVAVLSGYPVAP